MKGDKPIGSWGILVLRFCKNCHYAFEVLKTSKVRTCAQCRRRR
jgi:protein-arginine kinase activator protein McsA